MADTSTPRPGEHGREDLKSAADEARRAAGSATETARTRAAEAAQQARERAQAEAEARQRRAGEEAERLAEAFRAGEQKLGHGWQARAFHYAAEATDEFAHTLRDRSPGDLIGAVSAFGRRNPALFVGGATLLGFALSRFATAKREPRYGSYVAGSPASSDPYGTFDRGASPSAPGRHTMPLAPSAPTPPASAPTYPGAPGVAAPSVTPRPTTPGSAAASDPLSPTARPVGGPGEIKREL